MLTSFDAPTPEALLQRYNLSQAQGVLYRASHVVITAHRNDPGEYKLLFRYVKLFGLMAYRTLPVSDLPNVDFPTITVSAWVRGVDGLKM